MFGVPDNQPTRTTDKYQIVVYAGFSANGGGLKVNDKATVQYDLSETKDGDAKVVKVTQPTGKMRIYLFLYSQLSIYQFLYNNILDYNICCLYAMDSHVIFSQ